MTTTPPIDLACVDMAGTTVSDAGCVDDAFRAAVESEGIEAGTPRFEAASAYVARTMGQSKITVFTALFDGDTEAATRANQVFERSYQSFIEAGRVEPIDGAEAALDWLRHSGVKVCLTTGFAPITRDAILRKIGWYDRWDLVLSPADSGRGRPYPDMILTAVMRLRVDDVASVAVAGDTASDLWSGHRAGASIVAGVLTGAHDRTSLETAPHTHVLESIVDLPPILLVS